MAKKVNTDEHFSLEKKLKELRALVDKMQSGNLGFDENVSLFKEGTSVIKECRTYLDESELLIRKLVGDEEEDLEV